MMAVSGTSVLRFLGIKKYKNNQNKQLNSVIIISQSRMCLNLDYFWLQFRCFTAVFGYN